MTLSQLFIFTFWVCATLAIGVSAGPPFAYLFGLIFLVIQFHLMRWAKAAKATGCLGILAPFLLLPIIVPLIITRNRDLRALLELDQLNSAIEAYKARLGDYPPDFSDHDTLIQHFANAFPKCEEDLESWLSTQHPTRDPSTLDPAEAIVFWLSELSTNPRRPLTGDDERMVYFEFDETRQTDVDRDGWMEYAPRMWSDVPYVYIDERTADRAVYPVSPVPGITGVSRAYKRSGATVDKFQIICAGEDGDYGADTIDKAYPRGIGYSQGDRDNLTNFSEGRRLEEVVP